MNPSHTILGALLISSASISYGQNLDEIYAKESAIHKYSSAIIHDDWVRDRYFAPGSVVNGAVAKIIDEVDVLARGYESLAQIGPVGDLTLIVNDVAKAVRLQALKSEDLIHRIDDLLGELDRAQNLLKRGPVTPDHPDFSRYKDVLDAQRADLSGHINKLKNVTKNLRRTVTALASAFGHDFFAAKLKAIALAKGVGDGEAVLSGHQEFIKAEVTAAPWLGRLEYESRRAIKHMVALEGESARLYLATLKTSHGEVVHELESSGLHPTELARIKAEVDSYLYGAAERYQQTIEPYPPSTIAQSMQRLKVRRTQNLCGEGRPDPSLRCDLLAWLRKIEPASIKTFDSAKLRELEAKWHEIEAQAGEAI